MMVFEYEEVHHNGCQVFKFNLHIRLLLLWYVANAC